MRRKRIIEMSSFGDDPIKDLGFVVFPASAGLDQRDCLFLCFLVASLENTKTKSFMLTLREYEAIFLSRR